MCTARLTYSGLEKPSHKCTVGANAGGNVLLFSFFFPSPLIVKFMPAHGIPLLEALLLSL